MEVQANERVFVSFMGKGLFEHGVRGVFKNYPYSGWTHLVFDEDWYSAHFISWLELNRTGGGQHRGGPEWERWSLGENAISLAPAYEVDIARVDN